MRTPRAPTRPRQRVAIARLIRAHLLGRALDFWTKRVYESRGSGAISNRSPHRASIHRHRLLIELRTD